MNRHTGKGAVYLGAMDDKVLLKHKIVLQSTLAYYKKQVEILNERIEMAEILIKQIDEKTGGNA